MMWARLCVVQSLGEPVVRRHVLYSSGRFFFALFRRRPDFGLNARQPGC